MNEIVLDKTKTRASWRRGLWSLLKWGLFLAVAGFVVYRGVELWQEDRADFQDVHIEWGWLIPAGIAYSVAYLPSVWFWKRLMERLGPAPNWADASRSFYCGHLGKYVPGKATVLIIRAALVHHTGCSGAVSALTATYETLVMMGVGTAVFAALAPMALAEVDLTGWPDWIRSGLVWLASMPVLTPVCVVVLTIASLPVLSRLLSWLAARLTPAEFRDALPKRAIGARWLGLGMLAFVVSWAILGLSLGFTLKALGAPLQWNLWPVWTAAISLATVLGFLAVFAPGGVGVREGLLMAALTIQPEIGPARAVLAAILLRIVWFLAEIMTAAPLYWGIRPATRPTATDSRPEPAN